MSEGQIPVSGLDIRQTTVKTQHLVDLQVTTPKIADVAVTIEKTDEPVWVRDVFTQGITNSALTTTLADIITETFDIPAWVGRVSVAAHARIQPRNTSGGVQGYALQVAFNGSGIGAATGDVPNGSIGEVTNPTAFTMTTPGATLEVTCRARTTTGTNSENVTVMIVSMIGIR